MSARTITAVMSLVFAVVFKTHLSIAAAGVTVSVSIPAVLVAALVLAIAAGTWLTVRHLRRFRSSPYPRPAWPLMAGHALPEPHSEGDR